MLAISSTAENDVLPPTEGEPVYFSVASDASNKGNRKMFPACVRYFSVSDGVLFMLLDFYEDSDETANGIHQALMNCLENHELDISHFTAYAADNANVNCGIHHSVYQLLSSDNNRIVKATCPAHITHNAFFLSNWIHCIFIPITPYPRRVTVHAIFCTLFGSEQVGNPSRTRFTMCFFVGYSLEINNWNNIT